MTFLGGNMTQWSVNSMLNSVFSDLCVDYGPGNDTVVLRSPVKTGMTMFEYVCCKSVNRYIITINFVHNRLNQYFVKNLTII